MKRKAPPAEPPAQPMVPKPIVDLAKLGFEGPKPPAKCSVCGADCAPNSTEGLCWVCRRLKISAWRDSDQQAAAQE